NSPMVAKYIVRHGSMRFLGEFEAAEPVPYARGSSVVVRTERGVEVGEVLWESVPRMLELLSEATRGQILRALTADDRQQLDSRRQAERHQFETCCRFVRNRQLQMELVDVEALFGGERIIFYFLAEKRVEFRDVVKDLAGEYKPRIEMRQIGVRDEAKLLADYGDCGKPVCCNTHMSTMPPVSMRMAKLQKSTLDPSKISGRCGRLKCCLR